MRYFLTLIAFALASTCLAAQENTGASLKQIEVMDAFLSRFGLEQFLRESQKESWSAPNIPSKWHVDHVSTSSLKPSHIAARNFGKNLALSLDRERISMQQLPIGKQLLVKTEWLLELYWWIVKTDGYGNFRIGQRTIDLAAVGVARLTANLDYPLAEIDRLIGRMNVDPLGPAACCRVLNQEVGAEVFLIPESEEMERTYGSGVRLLNEKKDPAMYERRQKNPEGWRWRLVEIQSIKDNLEFFEDPTLAELKPDTLLSNWDNKQHSAMLFGLASRNVIKAKALATFRSAIGEFPMVIKRTPEEIALREERREIWKKKGLKVTRFEDAYRSPREAAFAVAWHSYIDADPKRKADTSPQYQNLFVTALDTLEEVNQGTFLDRDTSALAISKR